MQKILHAKRDCRGMGNDAIIETILMDRGIDNLSSFLYPDESAIIPLKDLKNIDIAYQIIDEAIIMDESFLVLSDVDTDGVTASAIISRYLQNCGVSNVRCVINEGKKHGAEDFDLSLLAGVGVMIIVDSLNNDPSVYKRITDTGVKLIVLDHHIPTQELLDCDVPFTLVSSATGYPNPALSGAGVCLKMALYCDEMNSTSYANDLWVYAAIGITSDMCDLSVPENRYIVSRGLAAFKNPVVQKMVGTYLFNTESIAFSIAPLVNAAMRMSENELAMNVFLTDDEYEIGALVDELKKCKEGQNKIVDSMIGDLIKQGEKQIDKKCMFFFLGDVDAEIGGLIGNRLLSIYQRPLFVIRDSGDQYTGSMRAVGVENMLELVNSTGLATCQGHELAAGFFCDKNKFEAFKSSIEDLLSGLEFKCDVEADIEICAEQVNDDLIKRLGSLNRISGAGWKPITVMISVDNYAIGSMSRGKHLKITDSESGIIFIKWNDDSHSRLPKNGKLTGVGTIGTAYYGRAKYNQIVMSDYIIDKTQM